MTYTYTLKDLLLRGTTLGEAEFFIQRREISDKTYGHFCFLWLWSAHRQDYRHSRFYEKAGSERYWRRIDRVRAICTRVADDKDITKLPCYAGSATESLLRMASQTLPSLFSL